MGTQEAGFSCRGDGAPTPFQAVTRELRAILFSCFDFGMSLQVILRFNWFDPFRDDLAFAIISDPTQLSSETEARRASSCSVA